MDIHFKPTTDPRYKDCYISWIMYKTGGFDTPVAILNEGAVLDLIKQYCELTGKKIVNNN